MILIIVSIILFIIFVLHIFQNHKNKEYFENNKKCIGNALSGDKNIHLTNAMIDTYYTKSQLGNIAKYNSNRTLEALTTFKNKFETAKQQEKNQHRSFTSITGKNSTYVGDQVGAQNNAEQRIKQLKLDADERINQIDNDMSKYVDSTTKLNIPDKIKQTLKDETTRQLSLIEPPKPLDFSGSFTQKENEYNWTIGDNNTLIRIEPITRQIQCVATSEKDKCATDKGINDIKRMDDKDIPILSCNAGNYNNINHWCHSSYKKLANKYDNIIDYTNCPVNWELNNAKQCVPKSGVPTPQLIDSVKDQKTVLFYNGTLYRSLSENWEYNSSSYICQTEYMQLPNGWSIAPNNDDSKYVISNYRWSTAVMVLSDGSSYYTNIWGDRQIRLYSNGMLLNSYNTYRPNVCNGGILLVKNKQQTISSITWNDNVENKRNYMKDYSHLLFPFKINVANNVSSVINKALDEKLGTITSKKTINVNLDKFTFYRNGVLVRTFAYTPSNGRGAKITDEITTSSINYSWNSSIDTIFNIPRTQNIFIEFTGYIFIPEETTSVKFYITANTAMKFSLAVDGKIENIRSLNNEFLSEFTTKTISVQEKQYLPFIIEYYQIGGTSNPSIRLEWALNNSSKPVIVPRAVYYIDKNQCNADKINVPKFSNSIGRKEIDEITRLPAGIVGWYDGGSFDNKTNRWLDKSGNSNHITNCFGQINTNFNSGNGSTETKYITGDKNAGLTLPSPVVWNGGKYTFFHITRYAGNTNGRIWAGTTGNWLSGHWSNRGAAIHQDGWLSGGGRWSYEGMLNGKDWTLITDQSSYARVNRASYQFWGGSGNIPQNISINNGNYNEKSDWACAEVIIYQRELSVAEIEVVESFLYTKNKLSV